MHNNDKPGVIGAIGRALGSRGINIAKMHLSRQQAGGVAISLIHVDEPVEDAVLRRLSKVENILSVKQITL
jgi:D-3-phosphoglycerate dehydrogenase